MESKKINQLATEMSPATTDLTIVGDPITGVSKKITLEQIASLFAGSVSFYANLAAFPVTGTIDTIYCAKDTNKLYLWSGSAYVQTFPSQALLDTYQLRSEKGASNGYASLDSSGKVPVSQLPSSIMEYKGMWSAATNTPTLANGTGDTGDVYICNAAGSVNFGAGVITFAVGDYVIYSGSIWQRSSGAVGTVTSVAITESGDSLNITGSPITTSGTINIGFNGTNLQYVNGAGNLTTFPILTGYVPYTGATQDVDLGAFKLNAQSLHIKGTGGLGHLGLKHQSASATASANEVSLFADSLGDFSWLNGNLYLSKFITSGNTAARSYTFPNANGTVALTSDLSNYVDLTTAQTIGGTKTFSDATKNNGGIFLQNASSSSLAGYMNIGGLTNGVKFTSGGGVSNTFTLPSATGYTFTFADITGTIAMLEGTQTFTGTKTFNANPSINTGGQSSLSILSSTGNSALIFGYVNNILKGTIDISATEFKFASAINSTFKFQASGLGIASLIFDNTTNYSYTFPAASGTIALVGGSGVGTVTSVAALTIGTSGTDLSSTVANSTTTPVITLNVPTASATNRGVLSSTDWTTFNNKQGTITLTTTGTSGAATFTSNTLNIPNYGSALSGYLPLTGGTLTGALSGTSATFSGNGAFSGVLQVAPTTGTGIIGVGDNFGGNMNAGIYRGGLGVTTSGNYLNIGGYDGVVVTTGAAALGSQTPRMTITSTGNVGIGTSSPTSNYGFERNLTISSTNNAELQLVQTGNSNYLSIGITNGINYFQSTNAYDFQIGGGSKMRITSGGNVLIGTTTDAGGKLQVNGEIRMYGSTLFRGMSSSTLQLCGGLSSSNVKIDGSTETVTIDTNGATRLTIASTGAATFSSSVTAQLLAISNGYYLVGRNSANTAFRTLVTFDSSNKILIGQDSDITAITLGVASEAMRITSGGNVGIGTSSPTAISTFTTLEIRGATGGGIKIGKTSFAQFNIQHDGTDAYFNNTANGALYIYTNDAERVKVASSGAITCTSSVTATSFFESSDSRLKTLIQDNYQTKGIASITPKLYTKNGKVELGYYAQDFVGILDSAVSKGSDDMLSLSYREVLVAKVYALEQRIKELETK